MSARHMRLISAYDFERQWLRAIANPTPDEEALMRDFVEKEAEEKAEPKLDRPGSRGVIWDHALQRTRETCEADLYTTI
eukprot:15098409-Alexandrium_andersonii.AAC.1